MPEILNHRSIQSITVNVTCSYCDGTGREPRWGGPCHPCLTRGSMPQPISLSQLFAFAFAAFKEALADNQASAESPAFVGSIEEMIKCLEPK